LPELEELEAAWAELSAQLSAQLPEALLRL